MKLLGILIFSIVGLSTLTSSFYVFGQDTPDKKILSTIDQKLIISFEGTINSAGLSVGFADQICSIPRNFLDKIGMTPVELARLLRTRQASLECAETQKGSSVAERVLFIWSSTPW